MSFPVCPMFKDKIGKGFGTLCYVHEDCLGISCNVPFTLGSKKETLQASVELRPADLSINITFNGKTKIIEPDGTFVTKMVMLVIRKSGNLYKMRKPLRDCSL